MSVLFKQQLGLEQRYLGLGILYLVAHDHCYGLIEGYLHNIKELSLVELLAAGMKSAQGFAVPVVGIMPYFGGGLTEKRWAFNRMEETVLPKVGIVTNRENGIFPFWLSPFFLEQRKGLLFFGGYLYLENMLLKSKI